MLSFFKVYAHLLNCSTKINHSLLSQILQALNGSLTGTGGKGLSIGSVQFLFTGRRSRAWLGSSMVLYSVQGNWEQNKLGGSP